MEKDIIGSKNNDDDLRDDEGFDDGSESPPSPSFTEASSSSTVFAVSVMSHSTTVGSRPAAYEFDFNHNSTEVMPPNEILHYEHDRHRNGSDNSRLDFRYEHANAYDSNNNNNDAAKHDNVELEHCCMQLDSLLQERRVDAYNKGESENASAMAQGSAAACSCIIDVSTPATLERDFHAWLNQNEMEFDGGNDRSCTFGHYPSEFYASAATEAQASFYYPLYNSPSELLHSDDFLNYGIYGGSGYMPLNCLPDSGHCASSNSTSSVSPGSAGSGRDCPNLTQFAVPTAESLQQLYNNSTPVTSNSDENTVAKKLQSARGKSKAERRLQRGTNLYGRPYCPGRPLSMEERAQIINLFHGGMKVNAISKRLCISHGCVSKIITRFRETGLLIPSSHSECRRRKRLLAAAQQQEHHHQQQLILQQQQLQHQQLLRQQRQFLFQQQQKEHVTDKQKKEPNDQQTIKTESC